MCWTHDVEELVRIAKLHKKPDTVLAQNSALALNWQVVNDWKETSRYSRWTEHLARQLFDAVTSSTDEVLPWIMDRW
jgi:hypothetical protein